MLGVRKHLMSLQGETAHDIRNGWHHYQCFMCDDKSHHLGINWESGHVRCLRCGYRTSLNPSGQRSGGILKREDPEEYMRMANAYTRQDDTPSCLDTYVYQYAKSRGLIDMDSGWALGRGELVGNLVFPVLDRNGKTVYLQYRNSGSRWRSLVPGLKPRLDYYPYMKGAVPKILVLSEGPIDAIKIRQATTLWASPTFGVDGVTKSMIRDIRYAEFNLILVWFDSEPRAEVKANRLARLLKYEVGCETKMVAWDRYTGTDQGACGEEEITNKLGEYV